MPFGEPHRTFTLQVKKGGQWLSPGIRISCPYVEATKQARSYALRVSAQSFRIIEDGVPIAEANVVRTFKWLYGTRDFPR